MHYTPNRDTGVKFMIDTNAINARQRDPALNQLEAWRASGAIALLMPDHAFKEAVAGGDAAREAKASRQVRTNSARISQEQKCRYAEIERAIFPNGVMSQNQRNDVEIVYQAADWRYILVTNDGASQSQPRGILGARAELARLDVTVMRPQEAVEHIRKRIRERDSRVTTVCETRGMETPDWVGRD